jgi:hypothetical protein
VEDVCLTVVNHPDPDERSSIHDLFRRASPDLSDKARFINLISEWLGRHPEMIVQWSGFSSDTRATAWPYFSLDGLEVGFYSTIDGGFQRSNVLKWKNAADACADYLYRAFKWVLERDQ